MSRGQGGKERTGRAQARMTPPGERRTPRKGSAKKSSQGQISPKAPDKTDSNRSPTRLSRVAKSGSGTSGPATSRAIEREALDSGTKQSNGPANAAIENRSVPRSKTGGGARPKREQPAAGAPQRTRRETKAATEAVLQTGIQTLTVTADEADMRLDRFLTARFPQIAFTHIQRIVRTGQLRVDGKRMKPNERLAAGQSVRVPPLRLQESAPRALARDADDLAFLSSITLYEDKDVLVLNKPAGLAVQGGSGTVRHVDGLLGAMRDKDGQKPRLVHRLDKETAGCLVVAKTRFAAAALSKSFRSRTTCKVYWAICAGVPRVRQGRVSAYIAKVADPDGETRMAVAGHGDRGADHALSYYAVVDQSAQKLSWLSLKPVTGRTHQLRVHAAHMGHPIIGDDKYFNIENWELPGGIQNRLHLLARRIVIPHPRTGRPLDVTAPLPPHMQQTFNLLGLDAERYDPIVEAPED